MDRKMQTLLIKFCIFACFSFIKAAAQCTEESCRTQDMQEALQFLAQENELLRQRQHARYLTEFNYQINVTEHNRQLLNSISTDNAVINKQLALKVRQRQFERLDNEFVQRQVKILSELGADVLAPNEFKQLKDAISAMASNYATVKACSFKDTHRCDLNLEPEIQEHLVQSRNAKELAHYWQQWHDKAGTPMREHFKTYVTLTRKAAELNNYTSYADYWIHFYDDPEFEQNLDAAFATILPFYKELHAFVRQRLFEHYGSEVLSASGNIPIHLLGNMWGQQWDEIIELITPYPEHGFLDVTAELKRQNYTILKFFELGDEFFKSLNMRALPASFWKLSIMERPKDREIICHASAWDFFENSDVAIKMCTEVNDQYLYVVHHELGHIQYYLQYEQQPTVFRNAPNPGFHEAVGDVIALSVTTMKHLKTIGLTEQENLDEQRRINELFRMAMKKIVFLPFAYTMDRYRYGVFRGKIPEMHWNTEFWKMRAKYGGVEPPVARSDTQFDPPAKFHLSADIEYLRYFAAHIFQFQFHKALCIKAKQYKAGDDRLTLDNCDIYNSKEAGAAFSKFLSYGASKNWREVLQEFTGETVMDTSALVEYFEPLRKWLRTENERLGVKIGWENEI